MALIGHVDQISRSQVEGWVVDPDRPDEIVSLSIFVNGVHGGTCLTTHTREDLVLPNGEPITGKCAFYFAFDPPLSPFIELKIDVVETWSGEGLLNGTRILPRPSHGGGDAGVVPILLTSTGRTGTTLLMSEFARHPDIVLGDHFPYEIKQIAYHAAAFRALAADADRERSTTPENMLAAEMNRIVGSNPYNMSGLFGLGGARNTMRDFYQAAVPSGFATLFRKFILEFYATLAAALGKSGAPFFCEKGDIDDAAVQGARLFFDTVKDIVIVRDPRDLLCSSIAFWKLRPEAAMAMLTTTIPRLGRIARHAGSDTKVIRYEDLVRDPAGTRRALSDFLDLDLAGTTRSDDDAIPDSHRTSRDPAASIGRWRNDLTPQQIETCEVAFSLFMREFGYEPSKPPRTAQTGNDILAAEGGLEVAAFVENTVAETETGIPSRRVLELTFGRGGNGEPSTLEGWSFQERGFIWSGAAESALRLPAIRESGDYRLHITAAPFTHGTELPAQRIAVLIDGHDVGTARVSDLCVLSMALPASVALSGETITVTLRFPDAARPSDVVGGGDHRLLGISLYRVALFRVGMDVAVARKPVPEAGPAAGHPLSAAVGQASGDAAPRADPPDEKQAGAKLLIARLTDLLRATFEQPAFSWRARTRLSDIPGYDPLRFVNLILALEATFGFTLHEDDVDSIVTMGDLVALLRREMPEAE